jgi:hypothetical protein
MDVAWNIEPKAAFGRSKTFTERTFAVPALFGTALSDAHPPNESNNAASADAHAVFCNEI